MDLNSSDSHVSDDRSGGKEVSNMLYSGHAQYLCDDTSVNRRIGQVEEGRHSDQGGDAIPRRYRDGRGGIDLERVRGDRLRARQRVISAMLRRLRTLWRH